MADQYQKIKAFIQSRIHVTDEELNKSLQYSSLMHFQKSDLILRIGEYCNFIGFVNHGLIVTTYIDHTGSEKASQFIFEGCFFTYTEGLATHTPCHKNFVALENSEILILGKDKLATLFAENPKFEKLFAQLLTEEIRSLLVNEETNKSASLDDRYLNLTHLHPQVFQRVPLKYIADYLGIEAPSLSRLRKRLSKNKN